jgi:hypothetical protein
MCYAHLLYAELGNIWTIQRMSCTPAHTCFLAGTVFQQSLYLQILDGVAYCTATSYHWLGNVVQEWG